MNTEAKDAEIRLVNGKINIIDHEIGKRVLKEDLLGLIDHNINKLEDITIPVEDVIPAVTNKLLARINGIIGGILLLLRGVVRIGLKILGYLPMP